MTVADRPNVLLLVMDTARVDAVLGRPDVAPNVAEIAAEGTTYTNAFATGPWTLPSHASLFSGQYTSEHGAHAGTKRFDPDVPTLAERLASSGYRTVGFSNNTWVSSDFGFDRGFEEFRVGWQLLSSGADLAAVAKEADGTLGRIRAGLSKLASRNAPATLLNVCYSELLRERYDNGAWLTNRRIDRWLGKRTGDRPFFVFANYLEPHLEYDPPRAFRDRFLPDGMEPSALNAVNQDAWSYIAGLEEMDGREFEALRALYHGEVNYLDHRIGRLYETLESHGVLEETVLVIVGDHGENLGDHGLMDHQYCLYDTLVRVPLVVRYPDAFDAGETADQLVELRDLYPTILELAGLETPSDPAVSTHSLLAPEERSRAVSEYRTPQPSMAALEERVGELTPELRRYDRALRSVRTHEWAYVEGTDGARELYDRREDPDETTNLAEDRPTVCEELAAVLEERLGALERADDETSEMDDAAKQRLEDLGYLQ
ncbi:sulfatase [Natrononativus amylolyticus]|uniref:sulfatase n=1 Tax=Natrononativus amylolyticus TaxID=2963434 RepID=UPI0020CC2E21|nr:sulfatase [Natrononativus amylolyticus]